MPLWVASGLVLGLCHFRLACGRPAVAGEVLRGAGLAQVGCAGGGHDDVAGGGAGALLRPLGDPYTRPGTGARRDALLRYRLTHFGPKSSGVSRANSSLVRGVNKI